MPDVGGKLWLMVEGVMGGLIGLLGALWWFWLEMVGVADPEAGRCLTLGTRSNICLSLAGVTLSLTIRLCGSSVCSLVSSRPNRRDVLVS